MRDVWWYNDLFCFCYFWRFYGGIFVLLVDYFNTEISLMSRKYHHCHWSNPEIRMVRVFYFTPRKPSYAPVYRYSLIELNCVQVWSVISNFKLQFERSYAALWGLVRGGTRTERRQSVRHHTGWPRAEIMAGANQGNLYLSQKEATFFSNQLTMAPGFASPIIVRVSDTFIWEMFYFKIYFYFLKKKWKFIELWIH